MSFYFIITARGSLHLAKRCIESIRGQQGDVDFDWLYIDDCSGYSADERMELQELMCHKVMYLDQRHYQVGAIHQGVCQIQDPDTIVCLVDGDDYLLGDALEHVKNAYQDPMVMMTYGNTLIDFRPYQDTQEDYFYDKKTVNTEYASKIWDRAWFREDGFRCFHMRTFKRWLWDHIDPRGFFRQDGTPIRASGDSAFVFPMLELLGSKQHVKFIEDPIYVYRLHGGNVHNSDKKSQSDDLDYIRYSLPKYQPLDREIVASHIYQAH